jgi:hypothetical protein
MNVAAASVSLLGRKGGRSQIGFALIRFGHKRNGLLVMANA